MERIVTGREICSGKFLFSGDKVVLANNESSNLEVHFAKYNNGSSGKQTFVKMAEKSLDGEVTSMELCSVSNVSKTFAAVSSTTPSTNVGSISLIEVATTKTSAVLIDSLNDLTEPTSSITSLSFQSDNNILAASTEDGHIIVYDLQCNKEVCRVFSGDADHISKLKFFNTNQLVSICDADKSIVKVWDIKTKNNNNSTTTGVIKLQGEVANKSFSPSSSSQKSSLHNYSSLTTHNANKLFCGCVNGSVVVWDVRATHDATNLVFKPHLSAVTDLIAHPTEANELITCSTDGSVRHFNYTDYSASSIARSTSTKSIDFDFSSGSGSGDKEPFIEMMSEDVGFVGVDVDPTGAFVMGITSKGEAIRTTF